VTLRGAVVGKSFSVLLVKVEGKEWKKSTIQVIPVGEVNGKTVVARQIMPVRLRQIVDSGEFYKALKTWVKER
jgi:hypothetical protein